MECRKKLQNIKILRVILDTKLQQNYTGINIIGERSSHKTFESPITSQRKESLLSFINRSSLLIIHEVYGSNMERSRIDSISQMCHLAQLICVESESKTILQPLAEGHVQYDCMQIGIMTWKKGSGHKRKSHPATITLHNRCN